MEINKTERAIELRIRPGWRNPFRATLVILTNFVVVLLLLGATKAFEIIFDYIVGTDIKIFSFFSISKFLEITNVLILVLFIASTVVQMVQVLTQEK